MPHAVGGSRKVTRQWFCAVAIASPPISPRCGPRTRPLKLDQLLERRDAIYDNLRDLRFEFRAGKYSEKDYEEIKQSLEIEAARVLADMDTLTGSTPTPATRQAAAERPRNS